MDYQGYGTQPTYVDEMTRLRNALAEKDLEWKRRVGLDCGGHSCCFAIEKKGMRHNGPCTCNPKRTKEDHDRLYKAYHTLMGQAVRFAERLNMYQDSNVLLMRHRDVDEFLASPEVQAWRKQEEQK